MSVCDLTQRRDGVGDDCGIAVDQKVAEELDKAAPLGFACISGIQLGYAYCRRLAHVWIAVFEMMAELLGQIVYDDRDGYIGHGTNRERTDEWIAVVAVLGGNILKRRRHGIKAPQYLEEVWNDHMNRVRLGSSVVDEK